MNDTLKQLQSVLPTRLRHCPWLDDLDLRPHSVAPKTVLYRPGSVPSRIYFVVKGWVAGAVDLSPKTRPFCALRIRGDVIGLNCLPERKAAEEVVTITACDLVSVPSQQVRKLVGEHAELRDYVHENLTRDINTLQIMNAVIGRLKAPERLAYFLYILLQRSKRNADGPMDTLVLPMTQDEIGQMLGLTNVSVNRAFRKLESDLLIRTGRQSVTFLDEDHFVRELSFETKRDLIKQVT